MSIMQFLYPCARCGKTLIERRADKYDWERRTMHVECWKKHLQDISDAMAIKWHSSDFSSRDTYTMESPKRLNLTCAFKDKDQVKALGARWDPKVKRWHAPDTPENRLKFGPYLTKGD